MIYETIYKRLSHEILPALDGIDIGGSVKLTAPFGMDLHIDVLNRNSKGLTISLAHYYEKHFDLVPDPDMVVKVHTNDNTEISGMAEAISYQDIFGYQVVDVQSAEGRKHRKMLNNFLAKWLLDICTQGYSL